MSRQIHPCQCHIPRFHTVERVHFPGECAWQSGGSFFFLFFHHLLFISPTLWPSISNCMCIRTRGHTRTHIHTSTHMLNQRNNRWVRPAYNHARYLFDIYTHSRTHANKFKSYDQLRNTNDRIMDRIIIISIVK